MQLRSKLTKLLALVPVSLFLLLLLNACGVDHPQSTFGPQGPIAEDQLRLFWIIFWMAVFVFVLVEGFLVYIIVKFGRKPTDSGLPPQVHGNTRLEIIWTIIPVFLLIIVAVPTYTTIASHAKLPEGKPILKVDVIGHQWWWEFRYPDLGVVTANELIIPTNTAIDVTLHSQDVIHSFWIPKLAGKVDVIPTRANKMNFLAPEVGEYFGQCAELCGVAHALMKFRAYSYTQADFDDWVARQKAPPKPPDGDLAVRGEQLFGTKGCLVCHTVDGSAKDIAGAQDARMSGFLSGNALFPAPNLTTFGDRRMLGAGIEENNTQSLRKWVSNPGNLKQGTRMEHLAAAYQGAPMSQAEVDALVAYLQGRTTDPNARPASTPTAATTQPTPTGQVPSGNVSLEIYTVANSLEFNTTSLAVKTGSDVTMKLVNKATSAALEHNWVLVKAGSESAVEAAGLAAGPSEGWTPTGDPNVIANTALIKGGASGSVSFKAPAAGTYGFLCTFPGHSGTMRGTFAVLP